MTILEVKYLEGIYTVLWSNVIDKTRGKRKKEKQNISCFS